MRLKMIVIAVAAFCLFAVPSFAANVTGTWEGQMAMPKMQGAGPADGSGAMRPMKYVFNLKQDGTKLSGSVKGPFGPVREFTDGRIEGNKISFSYKLKGLQGKDMTEMTVKWDGAHSGEEITFTLSVEGAKGGPAGGMPQMQVVVKRQKESHKP